MNDNAPIAILLHSIEGSTVQTVNARDLHAFLRVGRDFSSWLKDQVDRARLKENRDFLIFTEKGENSGRPKRECYLSLESAKHVAMMSGTDKGFEVREYFIECERRANSRQPISKLEALQMAIESETRALALEAEVEKQKVVIKEAKPKVEFYDQVSQATNSQTVADCAKALGTGELRLFRWLRANGFLMSNNKPYQRFLDLGWFKVAERTWTHPETGEVQLYAKTLITASGLQAIYRAMVPGDDLLASAKQKRPRKFGESLPRLLN